MSVELEGRTGITSLIGDVSAVNYPIAGEYHALGINLPGDNGEDLQRIQQRLQNIE